MSRLGWLAVAIAALVLILVLGRQAALPAEADTLVRVLAIGGWGLLVAVGLVRSGLRISAFVRNLALWALVLVIFVGFYQYRYELQDVASRVTAGFLPGSPLSATDAEGRVTVELDRGDSGHFQALGSVNGAAVRFLVDTGASTIVLSARDAERAGYDLSVLAFNIPVATANGEARAASARAASLRIGAISRAGVGLLVAAPGQLDQSLLGMNFIGSLSGFDMRGDRMILRD